MQQQNTKKPLNISNTHKQGDQETYILSRRSILMPLKFTNGLGFNPCYFPRNSFQNPKNSGHAQIRLGKQKIKEPINTYELINNLSDFPNGLNLMICLIQVEI
ncbi:unnamed protein product [Paramecium octaurelia]|uniref:Uncharacterized protein n=1 Tax=Paramecium octaurelia TaxID=43137 RepID=A0A8S1TTC3_PAROT|nr:unnamed protein product [Paramecium octaurelia]